MNILLINPFPLNGSGSGVYVSNIAKKLEKKGHNICIIIPENTTNIEQIENVKIHPIYFKSEEKIKGQLGFNFICFDPHPRSSLLFSEVTNKEIQEYIEAFRKAIEEEIKTFKPDIIHSRTYMDNFEYTSRL